jgi:hypothetical protein
MLSYPIHMRKNYFLKKVLLAVTFDLKLCLSDKTSVSKTMTKTVKSKS